ncbi:hypothetical protein Ccrd_013720 [Cynara cardunculus var. scolymus]|uniref:Uncharacterized protein n=1 Tax=Cynara cardunculus var. scolymus TaxID=59895 RepID=A0A118K4Q5_CYNCS|nr:hypothetical protein Ccrd_013720 [Cynara cardunculus var. scolymus]
MLFELALKYEVSMFVLLVFALGSAGRFVLSKNIKKLTFEELDNRLRYKSYDHASWLKNSRSTGSYYSFFLPATFLLCLALLVGTIVIGRDQTEDENLGVGVHMSVPVQKSLKRGIEAIRGSRYPKVIVENLQPSPSPQPSPQLQPQMQQEPSSQPQLQPQTQLQPSPLSQLELQTQPQIQHEPSPQPQPQPHIQPHLSPQHQSELQTQPQPSPQTQPQPSPQLQQQTQMQQEDQNYLSQSQCRPPGSEPLPKGLVANTADLQMQPLWGRRKIPTSEPLCMSHFSNPIEISTFLSSPDFTSVANLDHPGIGNLCSADHYVHQIKTNFQLTFPADDQAILRGLDSRLQSKHETGKKNGHKFTT